MNHKTLATVGLLFASSCISHGASAGMSADSSIAGIRSQIGEVSAALVEMRSDLRAGRDVNNNDKWTFRVLGVGVLILGLSYPVGKIVWLATIALKRRAIGAASESVTPMPALDAAEWLAFRHPPGRADALDQA